MRTVLLAMAACVTMGVFASARADTIQIVPNPQYQGTAAHRLACNEWDRCIQVPGFSGRVNGGYVSTQNSYFTSGDAAPQSGRVGGLEFYKPN
jgi:hypothetical protein